MTDEIINDLRVEEVEKLQLIHLNISLDRKKLKLLKELHGTIGLDEFIRELSVKIKMEIEK